MSSNQDTKAIIIQPEGRGKTPLQEWPVHTECPHCGGFILTSLEYETGTLTWIMCFFIMFIGLFLGCCLVPFCMDGCKDIAHICPDCKKEVGRFYRIWNYIHWDMHDSIAYHVLKFAVYILSWKIIFSWKSLCVEYSAHHFVFQRNTIVIVFVCVCFCKDYIVKQCTNKPMSADMTVHI